MRGPFLVAACCALALACGSSASHTNEVATEADQNDPGAAIYNSRCTMCHGRGGNLNMSGAKDLTKSALSKEEMITVVTNGKGGMIGFGKMLSKKEVDEVVDHIRTLHIAE